MFNLFKKSNKQDYDSILQSFLKNLKKTKWDDYQQIESLLQPAISVVEDEEGNPALGQTKFGGTPDLPNTLEWPKYDGKSMVFFAQLNLAEIEEFHRHDFLPSTGVLYFFSYFPEPENEFGAAYDFVREKEKSKVMYYQGDVAQLSSTPFPSDLTSEYHFASNTLAFETFFHLPPSAETIKIETSTLSDSDKEKVEEFNDAHCDQLYNNQILGIPNPMQYGVDFDLALAHLHVSFEDYESSEEKKIKIDTTRDEFVYLLAMPQFERIGDSQGYFGIHINDLKSSDFEKALFVMQGT
jgi:uncharacterized protein YwqG